MAHSFTMSLSCVLMLPLMVIASMPSDPPTTMTTITVPNAATTGAVFPNGLPWQYQLNLTTNSTGWIIHMSGGGWSFMKNNSAESSTTVDGKPQVASSGCYGICDGIMSNDPGNNPDFHAYNKVD